MEGGLGWSEGLALGSGWVPEALLQAPAPHLGSSALPDGCAWGDTLDSSGFVGGAQNGTGRVGAAAPAAAAGGIGGIGGGGSAAALRMGGVEPKATQRAVPSTATLSGTEQQCLTDFCQALPVAAVLRSVEQHVNSLRGPACWKGQSGLHKNMKSYFGTLFSPAFADVLGGIEQQVPGWRGHVCSPVSAFGGFVQPGYRAVSLLQFSSNPLAFLCNPRGISWKPCRARRSPASGSCLS
eukprot:1159895-Pelagomonas_calceolata.AAC.13